ncbi:MAG TPA: hypothetical protein VHF06_16615, partial [Pseudonocardiaceae bacterium]|nr:hypothetical protein [Pseudonocardiaceae bacterium]
MADTGEDTHFSRRVPGPGEFIMGCLASTPGPAPDGCALSENPSVSIRQSDIWKGVCLVRNKDI